MKKLLKIVAVVFVMVMMCGAVVSADEAKITPTVLQTGTENPNSFQLYQKRYDQSAIVEIGGKNYSGIIYPIVVTNPGRLTVAFDSSCSLSAGAEVLLLSDRSSAKGTRISYTTTSLANVSKAVDITTTGTYYLMFNSSTYYSSLTSNNIAFRVYMTNSSDRVISSGQTVAIGNDTSVTKYFQITLPTTGHIVLQANTNISVDVCNSSKTPVFPTEYLNTSATNKGTVSYYLNAGTYYIASKGSYNYIAAMRYDYYPLGSAPYYVTKKNQNVIIYPGDYQNYHYIKYKAPYTGYVTLTPSEGSAYVTLCTSKRKAISSEDRLYGSSSSVTPLTYGVKKGTTYYFKVKSGYNPFGINFKTTKVSEKSGTSKKKAKTINSNKTAKGTIQANSSTVDWYKFKLTKTKKTNLWFKGHTNGKLKITIYNSKSTEIYSTTERGSGFGCKIYSIGKWKKGTYYVKVERANKKSSGYYTLKWK